MDKTEKIRELKTLLSPPIERQGAFLVDLTIKGDRQRELIEVFCETEKGITINQCADISREILPLIDSSQLVAGNFRLEVSSPGVGTPLKDRRQFKRNIGRLMSVRHNADGGVRDTEGELVELTDENITLKTGTTSVVIGFDSIAEARVKIRW